jgi:hypothetical protein
MDKLIALGVLGVLGYALYQRSKPPTGRYGRGYGRFGHVGYYGDDTAALIARQVHLPTRAAVAQRVAEKRAQASDQDAEQSSDSVEVETTSGVHGEGVDPRPGVYHGWGY